MTDLELYNKAKEAYYNGVPIMEDFEFDELEKKLGLENKGYIGAKKNPSYTIKHPFIMGSLSKVQIKEDEEGNIDFKEYVNEVNKYIRKNDANSFIITPKFDGCSFECIVNDKKIVSISSRGDGEYGKDLSKHLINKILPNVNALNKEINAQYILRGEVLINKFVFKEKYSEFVNPRSFVSGILNRDYSEDNDFQEMLSDLSIVIYDTRVNYKGSWCDTDWCDYEYPDKPEYYFVTNNILKEEEFKKFYYLFEEYRREVCQFALDGIVFKPVANFRENNLTETRPKDCIAVKFVPELEETEVVDIKWQLSNKTREYTPVIIVKPVIMDGKEVTRASAHNFGYIINNKISVGTKVILSLAGDIIPFIYKVTNIENFDVYKINRPNDSFVDGVHLYKNMNEQEIVKSNFLASAKALNIPGIGPAIAEKIFNYLEKENKIKNNIADFSKDNILFFSGEDIFKALEGKTGENVKEAYETYVKNISFKDIILSCSFILCGEKVSEQIVKYFLDRGSEDWTSLPSVAYAWCFNVNSEECLKISRIMNYLGMNLESEKEKYQQNKELSVSNGEQIPIIMTGSPNNYPTKKDFLLAHPEYKETTSWKEVEILFTDSLDSNSSKMKKAKDKGIEIKLY